MDTGAPLASEPLELAPLVVVIISIRRCCDRGHTKRAKEFPSSIHKSPHTFMRPWRSPKCRCSRVDHSVSDLVTITMARYAVKPETAKYVI